VVGTSNAVIDFGVLNAALAAFPTRATVPLLAYNTAAVVLAATNSFVWNRRFTFRVRGPLRAGEVARFAVVAAGTAGLNDLVLLALSVVFPALMGSGALGANVLKLGAILGAMALSFFGMRFWVFLGKRLPTDPPVKARSLPSSP
jgi:putative flippase GtrA